MNPRASRTRSFPYTAAALALAVACGGESPTELDPRPASIRLERAELTFSASEGSSDAMVATVSVTNGGEAGLSGLAATLDAHGGPSEWLSAALDGGTAPALLTVTVSAADLDPGRYEADVRVDASGVTNSPQTVAVVLMVEELPPELLISQEEVHFTATEYGAAPPSRLVAVLNDGGGAIAGLELAVDFDAGQATEWLTVAIDRLLVPALMTLSVNTTSVPAGGYHARIDVTSPDAPGIASLDVSFELEAAPRFSVAATVLPAGGGRVTIDPTGGSYLSGTHLTLTAVPATGYRFAGWSGAVTGSDPQAEIAIDGSDVSVEALFSLVEPVLAGATMAGGVSLEWTLEWPCDVQVGRQCSTTAEDQYELEESTSSTTTGFQAVYTSRSTRESPFGRTLTRGPGTYHYRVRASATSWEGPYSEVVTVVVPEPPAAPSQVQATQTGQCYSVTWTDNSDDETGFRVQHSFDADFATFVSSEAWTVGPDETSMIGCIVPIPAQVMYFRIVAVNHGGESIPSPIARQGGLPTPGE